MLWPIRVLHIQIVLTHLASRPTKTYVDAQVLSVLVVNIVTSLEVIVQRLQRVPTQMLLSRIKTIARVVLRFVPTASFVTRRKTRAAKFQGLISNNRGLLDQRVPILFEGR